MDQVSPLAASGQPRLGGKTSKTSSPAGLCLMALDHHRLVSACGHPARTEGSTVTGGGTGRDGERVWVPEWRQEGKKMLVGAHLFPSLMPLRAVVPSLLTNRRRLLSENTRTLSLARETNVPPRPHRPPETTAPSLLLTSSKFWLRTIFSTMSSASIRVSLTQEGWSSTASCFRLGRDQDGGKPQSEFYVFFSIVIVSVRTWRAC